MWLKRLHARASRSEEPWPNMAIKTTNQMSLHGFAGLRARCVVFSAWSKRTPTASKHGLMTARRPGANHSEHRAPEKDGHSSQGSHQPSSMNILESQRMSAYAFNRQVPGPRIEVTEGDRLRLNVTNRLPEATNVVFRAISRSNDGRNHGKEIS